MYKLVAKTIVMKTLKCSPLSNKNISMTKLSKMMHTDCSMLIIYPSKLGLAIDHTLNQIISSAIVIYVSGFAGLIGILFLLLTMLLRYLMKIKIDEAAKELNMLSNKRITSTI